jgi:hypothetical protein
MSRLKNLDIWVGLSSPSMRCLVASHEIVTATAIVVAFRDAYLHAEISDKQKRSLASFRQTLSGRYSLNDVGMAGLRVWLELYKLCMRSIREDKAKTG